jgi:hypothetical protein
MASRSRHLSLVCGVCLHDWDAKRKPCVLVSPHTFSRSVELWVERLEWILRSESVFNRLADAHVWVWTLRLSCVLAPMQFLKEQTSRRCSFRYILQGIAGSRDVQCFPHARRTFAVPGSTARLQNAHVSMHGFATVVVFLCCLLTSAMGLSIWTSASHMHPEASRNIEAKHDPLNLNPAVASTSLRAVYDSLQSGNIMYMLPLWNGARTCVETSST